MNTDRYPRWQQRAVEQLGFSINLILTLALGGLAFALTNLDKGIDRPFPKWMFLTACLLLLMSALSGIISSITRLYDFRITAQIVREDNEAEKTRRRAVARRLGSCTWFFFWVEIAGFILGIAAVACLALKKIMG